MMGLIVNNIILAVKTRKIAIMKLIYTTMAHCSFKGKPTTSF